MWLFALWTTADCGWANLDLEGAIQMLDHERYEATGSKLSAIYISNYSFNNTHVSWVLHVNCLIMIISSRSFEDRSEFWLSQNFYSLPDSALNLPVKKRACEKTTQTRKKIKRKFFYFALYFTTTNVFMIVCKSGV